MPKTTNYNSMLFANSETEHSKLNENNMTSFTNTGRCNNCQFFNFGKMSCTKKNDDGTPTRANFAPNTVITKSNKGDFINVIKPLDCNDFTAKNKAHKIKPQTNSNT